MKKESLRRLGYRDLSHWLENPSHIYIGRGMEHYVPGARHSKWHNPFKLNSKSSYAHDNRQEVIDKYRDKILNDPELLSQLEELRGKVLGCWCKPLGCHGDVLVELVEAQFGQEIVGECPKLPAATLKSEQAVERPRLPENCMARMLTRSKAAAPARPRPKRKVENDFTDASQFPCLGARK